jgi:Ca2+-binding RTX toxin-like protein
MELRLMAGATLDFETKSSYDVTVEVDDAAVGTAPDDSASYILNIIDVNEAPTVSLANATTTLPEDRDTSTRIAVADVIIADDALGTNGLALSGPNAALFEIDAGVLYLRAGTVLDADANPLLDATVEVDDATVGATPDSVVSLAIAITPVDDGDEGVRLIDGTLYVIGSDEANDSVFIYRHNGQIKVCATFNDSNPISFAAADVDDIQVSTRGGNDVVVFSPTVYVSTTIDGGNGSDALLGGSGDDVLIGGLGNDLLSGQAGEDKLMGGAGRDDLIGGSGNDVIVGGDQDDLAFGGSGRDLMIGGLDNDWLDGGSDDDILVGGVTIHDNNLAALDSVMAVWTSSASVTSRVAALTQTGGLLEAGVAVFDDEDSDVLIGGSGRDLLFADVTFAGGDKDFLAFQHAFDFLEPMN